MATAILIIFFNGKHLRHCLLKAFDKVNYHVIYKANEIISFQTLKHNILKIYYSFFVFRVFKWMV